MKIAFPVKEDKGLDSPLDDHFGVAKHFLVIDTGTNEYHLTENKKLTAEGSKCKTSVVGTEESVEAVVTKCIGDGSQKALASADIKVLQAQKDTVKENLELINRDELKLFHIFDICRNKKNKKESGCGHHG